MGSPAANAGAMGSSAVGRTAIGAKGSLLSGLDGSAIHRFINQRATPSVDCGCVYV